MHVIAKKKKFRALNPVMASKNTLTRAIILTGLLAGTLDITAATIQFYLVTGKGPEVILRYIAGALFGAEVVNNQPVMPIIGLVMHYCIAMTFTAFYYWVYPRMAYLGKKWWVNGIVYGLLVWIVMNVLLVPLTRIGHRPFHLNNVLIGAGILVICIGIPIAYFSHRFYSRRMV